MKRIELALGAGVGVAAAGLAAYALAIEPLRLEVTTPTLFVPRLPEAWEGVRILLLADLHLYDWGRREALLIDLLARQAPPDLIVWAGDFLGNSDGQPTARRMAQEVAALFPDVPAFGILGNAEHKVRRAARARFQQDLAETGIRMLVNEWTELARHGQTLTIAGCDDPYYGWADIEKTLDGAPTDRCTWLLAHSPQVAILAAQAGVDLMLSGHTHGGQVRLPLLGPLKTQNPLGRRLDRGAFDRARLTEVLGRDPGGDLVAYVSRGIGLANLPGVRWLSPRFHCRPEVPFITLRAR